MKNVRVALVYDRVNKFGGAERVLQAMHEIWPDAPLYTAVYDQASASWARSFRVIPSFLNKFPWAKNYHELYAWLTPAAFESFDLDQFDIVISVTSAEAKNIITKPHTMHVCYCLTPTRYLWSGSDEYQKNPGIGLPSGIATFALRMLSPTLRNWDLLAAQRPDYYMAISSLVSERISTYYGKKTERIIYPPVETGLFARRKKKRSPEGVDGYFLVVSRLVGYKRVDLLIDAFNELGWPLVVVGEGREKHMLQARAKANIRFVGLLTDRQLAHYYEHCRAFVFAGSEDFGIAAVEAQASGVPVIAYRKSGIAEVVRDGKTGLLFDEQSVSSVIEALKKFTSQWYDSSLCIANAQRFSKARFKQEMKEMVLKLYNTYI
jgi:glycosyltransferase involved in cell wall biosynthesis